MVLDRPRVASQLALEELETELALHFLEPEYMKELDTLHISALPKELDKQHIQALFAAAGGVDEPYFSKSSSEDDTRRRKGIVRPFTLTSSVWLSRVDTEHLRQGDGGLEAVEDPHAQVAAEDRERLQRNRARVPWQPLG